MKKKGFTLVELLVVIAIIAMLLAILMPTLGRVRQLASRLMCGATLKGVGNALTVYSNDDEYNSYPILGDGTVRWSQQIMAGSVGWEDPTLFDRDTAGALINWDSAVIEECTVSGSLYLLVKFADVTSASFICNGSDLKKFEFNGTDHGANGATSATDVWDFGVPPWDHISYSYQQPYGNYPPSTMSPMQNALIADRNPWYNLKSVRPAWADFLYNGSQEQIKKGNSMNHQNEGQEVLFSDIHVSWEKTPNCGASGDNIYTSWNLSAATLEEQIEQGSDPGGGDWSVNFDDSLDEEDTLLVNVYNSWPEP